MLSTYLLVLALVGQYPQIHYQPDDLLSQENTCREVRVWSVAGDVTDGPDYSRDILWYTEESLIHYAKHPCHYARTHREVGDGLIYEIDVKIYLLDADTVNKVQLDVIDHKSGKLLVSSIKKMPDLSRTGFNPSTYLRVMIRNTMIEVLQKIWQAKTCR